MNLLLKGPKENENEKPDSENSVYFHVVKVKAM